MKPPLSLRQSVAVGGVVLALLLQAGVTWAVLQQTSYPQALHLLMLDGLFAVVTVSLALTLRASAFGRMRLRLVVESTSAGRHAGAQQQRDLPRP